MSDVAIRVEGLSKLYRLGKRERYRTLRDTLVDAVAAPFRSLRSRRVSNGEPETIWALKDVSFEVKYGEVIGIIGRNGAGKSTLLKILSRITEPTEGEAEIRGRVGSLLEVGTGFHPELTGRENIYLNGAILGMKRAEIQRKFDEIVAFAEVEKFLDTPVKRYSSGMYVRLAFAVAAHLEPEILIVDEVLAVGDVAFQKKCLGKMSEVSEGGRTVLFVSHNMGAAESLCGTGLLLERGKLARAGLISQVISQYTAGGNATWDSDGPIALGPTLHLGRLNVGPREIRSGGPLTLDVQLLPSKATVIRELAILIYSASGVRVAILDLRREGLSKLALHDSPADLRIDVRRLALVEGDYHIGIYIATTEQNANHLDLAAFSVLGSRNPGGVVPYHAVNRGFLELDFSFERAPVSVGGSLP